MATVEALERAVAGRDPNAARALAPHDDQAGRDLLAAVATNAAALDVRGFTARYVSEAGATAADGSWPGAVEVTWRFAGFDARLLRHEVVLLFTPTAEGVAITGVDDGGRTPLWLTGPVHVARTPTTLVLAQRADALEGFQRMSRRAVAVVRRVVPWPRARLVVEVPATLESLERALGAELGSYAGVAAVSASVDGSPERRSPVHVYVNPAVFATLQPSGAQIVLSHEATHVATGAATSADLPMWLLEGFADYVALRDTSVPVGTAAAQIIAAVRRDGPPAHLPGPAEFNARSHGFGTAYEAAWLACQALVDVRGERALVRLYEQVRDGADLETALRARFGFGVAELTRTWQRRLAELAG